MEEYRKHMEVMNSVAALKEACDDAYFKAPHSCSHAVWYVLRKLVRDDEPYRVANDLIDFLVTSPKWQSVLVKDIAKLANEGNLIVGGLKEHPNGHVLVVYPGTEKPRGGYYSGSDLVISRGSYARAMSTSKSSWPGAKSNGNLTVWDSWANDDKFKKVKFWIFQK